MKRITLATLIMIFAYYRPLANVNAPDPGNTFTCYLYGSSIHHDANVILDPTFIYDDDGAHYYSNIALLADPSSGALTTPWNCGRKFLFTEYIGTPVSLYFSYNSIGAASGIHAHNIIVKNAAGTILYTTFSPTGNTPLSDDVPYVLTTSTPGDYYVEYYRSTIVTPGVTPLNDAPDIIANVTFIKPLTELKINAEPICGDFSGSQYNFQIQSTPDFHDIMFQTEPYRIFSPLHGCYYPKSKNNLAFNFHLSGNVTINHGEWMTESEPYPTHGDVVSGDWWNSTVAASSDLNNFWIFRENSTSSGVWDNQVLAYYLSGGYHSPGEVPVISLNLYDGVTTTSRIYHIPILTPALPAPTPVDPYAIPGPGSDFIAPPNAVGIPNQSYDIYDYNVVGNENWTPTTNPIAIMRGGSSVPVIRVEHNITIPAGARLALYGGIRLEMGPNATIIEQRASSSSGTGAFLGISGATVTAYRGCNNDEHSTWSGIKVMGNPAWSQGSWPISPQGKLWLFDAEISYADAGVQNGGGTATSGGMIQSGGGNRFYNNKICAIFWPYTNMVGGTEHISTESLYESQFTCDNNAWFPITTFVGAIGIKGFSVGNSIFKNASSQSVSYGLYAIDAGSYIAGSTFKGFKNAIFNFSTSGTKTITVAHCNFENNHFGVYSGGSIAPAVQACNFNIPAYTAWWPLPSNYPGTNVLLLNDQNVGVVMQSSTGYNITTNSFSTNATPGHYYSYTTGTIQYATGGDPNLVTDNSFVGTGAAMVSNFINRSTLGTGLQYQCNKTTSVGYDIAVMGRNVADGGVNYIQKTNGPSGYSSAGNKFSGTVWNIFNQQLPMLYIHQTSVSTEVPIHRYGPITDYGFPYAAKCYELPSGSTSSSSLVASTTRNEGTPIADAGASIVDIKAATDANGNNINLSNMEKDNERAIRFREAAFNLNYYLTDTVPHPRDSVYYWATALNSPYGDLLITNLLIEDSLIDSAYSIYEGIPKNYNLGDVEANDFIVGKELLNIQVKQRINGTTLLDIEKDDILTLKRVKDNSSMWAHARAEGWLNAVTGEDLVDSLLYPDTTIVDTNVIDTTETDTTAYGQKHFAKNNKNNNVVKIYPSPVHDKISVEIISDSAEDIAFELLDVTGRSILSQSITTNHANVISVEKIQPGIYIYRVIQGNKPIKTGKLVKD